ncbi:hypothetical protein TWF281_001686 [Arthrobotrys megalospora]
MKLLGLSILAVAFLGVYAIPFASESTTDIAVGKSPDYPPADTRVPLNIVEDPRLDKRNPRPNVDTTVPDTSPRVGEEKNIDERVVSSTIFHTEFAVRCPTPEGVLGMDTNPANYPTIGIRRRPDFFMDYSTIRGRRNAVQRWIMMCRRCHCDQENGEMIPNPVAPYWSYCADDAAVLKCEEWFDCFCTVYMNQPQIRPENSIADYQDALNRILEAVKQQHPSYKWNPPQAPGISMTWNSGPYSKGNQHAEEEDNYRQLVPGTKEPYYLEGPGKGRSNAWPWEDGSFLGGYGGYGGYGSKITKRESMGESQDEDSYSLEY